MKSSTIWSISFDLFGIMETKSTTWFSLHLLLPFFLFSLNISLSTATDTITEGQSLSGNQTLVSKGGNFELGFFTPGNSHNYYIGIWYKNFPDQTIIWVANRESPISNSSSFMLAISESGDLVLRNGFNSNSVWSSNATSFAAKPTSAILLDTGNLVLINGSDRSSYIWQSFDHPTDTFMPGSSLSFNKITGDYTKITSWKNKEDPAPGLFEECMDPDGSNQVVLLWNGSKVYWQSGLWNGQFFSMTPTTADSSRLNLTFVEEKDRKYVTYTDTIKSVISRSVLEPSGQIFGWIWESSNQQWQTVLTDPVDGCDAYSLCGPFGVCDQKSSNICGCPDGFQQTNIRDWDLNDWSSGCQRKTKLQCGNRDVFVEMSNVRLPANPGNIRAGSENECKMACSNNCSCIAYAYDSSSGCSTWNGELRNIRQLYDGDSGGGTMFVRLSASDIPNSNSSHNKMALVVTFSIVAGLVAISSLVFGLLWACRRRKQTLAEKQRDSSLICFRYNELQRMTKNFSEKLGSGGFGSVFKGIMPDSTVVAVKKLEGVSQGEKQFRAEISILGVIQHVNLVRLCGFCIEGSKRLLVYEYMAGGSLDSHLFHDGPTFLNWKSRYQIILGAARGLVYLHEKCRECIMHCDVKPDNILLDDNFCPKVADFGLAKLFGRDFSRVLTTTRGTLGYLAPEWISGLPITPKVDVYSFGMTVLEIVSSKRNRKHSMEGVKGFYPAWVARKLIEGDVMSLVDERLAGVAGMDEVNIVCKVAIWCIQDEENRPSMQQVVQILERVLEVNTPPIPVFLQNLYEESGVNSSCAPHIYTEDLSFESQNQS